MINTKKLTITITGHKKWKKIKNTILPKNIAVIIIIIQISNRSYLLGFRF